MSVWNWRSPRRDRPGRQQRVGYDPLAMPTLNDRCLRRGDVSNRPFADGVDGAPNGIKRAKMVVVESAIWKGAVRGQVYHRYLVCHARRA